MPDPTKMGTNKKVLNLAFSKFAAWRVTFWILLFGTLGKPNK